MAEVPDVRAEHERGEGEDSETEGEEPGEVDEPDVPDPEEMRAALGGVATGLAEQLTTITQEVNKIREELYGDNGIGGIAQELEKMKAGSLGNLLEDTDLPISEGVRQRANAKQDTKPKGAGSTGRGAPFSLERERKLEELRRRIEDRHTREKKPEGLGFMEWLVIIFVMFVIAYTALPSFRVQVRETFQELVLGEVPEVVEEVQDFGAMVEEDTDSFF